MKAAGVEQNQWCLSSAQNDLRMSLGHREAKGKKWGNLFLSRRSKVIHQGPEEVDRKMVEWRTSRNGSDSAHPIEGWVEKQEVRPQAAQEKTRAWKDCWRTHKWAEQEEVKGMLFCWGQGKWEAELYELIVTPPLHLCGVGMEKVDCCFHFRFSGQVSRAHAWGN